MACQLNTAYCMGQGLKIVHNVQINRGWSQRGLGGGLRQASQRPPPTAWINTVSWGTQIVSSPVIPHTGTSVHVQCSDGSEYEGGLQRERGCRTEDTSTCVSSRATTFVLNSSASAYARPSMCSLIATHQQACDNQTRVHHLHRENYTHCSPFIGNASSREVYFKLNAPQKHSHTHIHAASNLQVTPKHPEPSTTLHREIQNTK